MRWLVTVTMLTAVCARAQPPAGPAPLLSPQAAYDDSTRPVDIVRKAISNWSDAEQYALGVAIKKSAIACAERRGATYAGDDLVALARLCSFGQQWPDTKDAAAKYIASDDAAKTQLPLAYGLQLDAVLHLHALGEIMTDAKAMLAGVPYDATVNEASDSAISYLQLAYTKEALELETIRQPLVLAAIGAAKPALPRHVLYASGLAQAELLQYANIPAEAEASVAALDAALGDSAKLSADEMVPIGDARRQYGLLGKPLPKLTLTVSLASPTEVPELDPKYGAGTAFLLFPDWCAQCVAMRGDLWKAAQVKQGIVRLFVLLAQVAPSKDAMIAAAKVQDAESQAVRLHTAVPGKPENPKSAAELMLSTQTFLVPPETTATFAAEDYPFLLAVDYAGVVRFAGSAPETVLKAGDFLDRVIEHVAETWPPQKQKN